MDKSRCPPLALNRQSPPPTDDFRSQTKTRDRKYFVYHSEVSVIESRVGDYKDATISDDTTQVTHGKEQPVLPYGTVVQHQRRLCTHATYAFPSALHKSTRGSTLQSHTLERSNKSHISEVAHGPIKHLKRNVIFSITAECTQFGALDPAACYRRKNYTFVRFKETMSNLHRHGGHIRSVGILQKYTTAPYKSNDIVDRHRSMVNATSHSDEKATNKETDLSRRSGTVVATSRTNGAGYRSYASPIHSVNTLQTPSYSHKIATIPPTEKFESSIGNDERSPGIHARTISAAKLAPSNNGDNVGHLVGLPPWPSIVIPPTMEIHSQICKAKQLTTTDQMAGNIYDDGVAVPYGHNDGQRSSSCICPCMVCSAANRRCSKNQNINCSPTQNHCTGCLVNPSAGRKDIEAGTKSFVRSTRQVQHTISSAIELQEANGQRVPLRRLATLPETITPAAAQSKHVRGISQFQGDANNGPELHEVPNTNTSDDYNSFRIEDAEAIPPVRFGRCEDSSRSLHGHPFDYLKIALFTRLPPDENFLDTGIFAKEPHSSKKLQLLIQRNNYWTQHQQARSPDALSSGVFWGLKRKLIQPPLHSHPTSFIKLHTFLSEVHTQETALFTFLNNELKNVHMSNSLKIPSSRISQQHLQKLLFDKVIVHCSNPVCGGLVKVTLEKIGTPKERFRFLGDLFQTNLHLQNLSDHIATKFTTPSMLLQQIYIQKCNYGASYDMKSYYQQIPLPSGFEQFCAFKVGENHYAFNSLPMGFNLAVPMAHALTLALTKHVVSQLGKFILVDVYIDNIAIFAPLKSTVDLFHELFVSACNHFDFRLGDISSGHIIEHRGMLINMLTYEKAIKPSFVQKLTQRLEFASKTIITFKHLESLIGMASYVLTILQPPGMKHLWNAYRFLAYHHQWKALMPTSVFADLTKAAFLSQTIQSFREERKIDVLVCTDASSNAEAAITIKGDCFTLQTIMCDKEQHINEKEMHALTLADVSNFPNSVLIMDSLVALNILKNRYTSNFGLFCLAEKILSCLKTVSLVYVPTEQNPADEPSRGKPVNQQKLLQLLNNLHHFGISYNNGVWCRSFLDSCTPSRTFNMKSVFSIQRE